MNDYNDYVIVKVKVNWKIYDAELRGVNHPNLHGYRKCLALMTIDVHDCFLDFDDYILDNGIYVHKMQKEMRDWSEEEKMGAEILGVIPIDDVHEF